MAESIPQSFSVADESKGAHYTPILLNQLIGGRYRVVSLLRWSKTGVVWVAEDVPRNRAPTQPPRYFALNIACPAQRPGDDHPTTPAVVRKVTELATSMDNLNFGIGRSAHDRLRILMECVKAVGRLHDSGSCHGNLGLSSFVLRVPGPGENGSWGISAPPGSQLRLGDLSVELIRGNEVPREGLSDMRAPNVGSPPEVIANPSAPASAAADIWALGCMLWRLLAGCSIAESLPRKWFDEAGLAQWQKKWATMPYEERSHAIFGMVFDMGCELASEDRDFVLDRLLKLTVLVRWALEPNPALRPTASQLLEEINGVVVGAKEGLFTGGST